MPESADVHEVVHELRNQLSAISSAAIAIRKSNYEPKFSDEMVDIIRNNVERATGTLNDLLESQPDGDR